MREFCGHGIGQKFHEEPQVLHYGRPGTLEELVPGMVFTIEPMVNAGRREIRETGDGWTIVTKDRSLSAQWEHTVLVTDTGYEVLTQSLQAARPPGLHHRRLKTHVSARLCPPGPPCPGWPMRPRPPPLTARPCSPTEPLPVESDQAVSHLQACAAPAVHAVPGQHHRRPRG